MENDSGGSHGGEGGGERLDASVSGFSDSLLLETGAEGMRTLSFRFPSPLPLPPLAPRVSNEREIKKSNRREEDAPRPPREMDYRVTIIICTVAHCTGAQQ